MRVSHETIYRSLYLQTRGVLHRELVARLRSKRTMRRESGAAPTANGADRSSTPSPFGIGLPRSTLVQRRAIGRGPDHRERGTRTLPR